MPFDFPPDPSPDPRLDVTFVAADSVVGSALAARVSGHSGWIVRATTSLGHGPTPSRHGSETLPRVVVIDLGPSANDIVAHLADVAFDLDPTIVLMSSFRRVSDALAAGARGALPRDVSRERLVAAIRAVAAGVIVLDAAATAPLVAQRRPTSQPHETLTAREIEVVQALSAGLTNRAAAERLGISEHTVKFHVNGLMSKLAVRTRTEAVVEAARRGLVVL